MRRRSVTFAIVVSVALILSSCSSSGASDSADLLAAEVATFDIVAGQPQRFTVGLFASDLSGIAAYGAVGFSFRLLSGDDGATPDTIEETEPVTATFLPIPGQDVDLNTPGPQIVSRAEATGVYATSDIEFDRPGFWEVAVEAQLDGRTERITAAFEVLEFSEIPAPGEMAPRTRQPLAGEPDVDPKAIDSRAGSDRPIPDPEMHNTTVADTISAGIPAMVVVSTPTFCVSQFCGPITDSVHELALQYGDEMAFIHIEVWQDFVANAINPSAAEWIVPTSGADAREPWVFVLDANGVISQRFVNVVSDAELLAAVEATIGD